MIHLRVPLLVASSAAVAGSIWWRERKRQKTIKTRLAGRDPVSAEAFQAALPHPVPRSIVEAFRRLVGTGLRLPPESLHPADHLNVDLGGAELSRTGQLFLVASLERHFRCTLPPVDVCFDGTVGELLAHLEPTP